MSTVRTQPEGALEPGEYTTPPLPQKIRLYLQALFQVPFYRYGEIGNLLYTVGKNILDGVILYTMFSMAEEELKVAAILGVVVKYAYPGITIVSANLTSGFIDRLESLREIRRQVRRLVRAYVGIGMGQALGGLFLTCCYPPVFKALFFGTQHRSKVIIALYFLHHLCDGSSQIVEGRAWFKIIEIKIRQGEIQKLSHNFWVIYALSQNFQLILGQVFLWGSLAVTSELSPQLVHPALIGMLAFGFLVLAASKFMLPVTYRLRLCS